MQQQQLSGQAYLERYGHAWNEPGLAQQYVANSDRDSNQRADGFKMMAAVVPLKERLRICILLCWQPKPVSVMLRG